MPRSLGNLTHRDIDTHVPSRRREFEIEVFTDEMILHQPQEQWPECNCLISFFSSGFPLEKAIAYSNRVR